MTEGKKNISHVYFLPLLFWFQLTYSGVLIVDFFFVVEIFENWFLHGSIDIRSRNEARVGKGEGGGGYWRRGEM